MRRVAIESPFGGTTEEMERNTRYVRACMADCLRRGEAPYASHALYTLPGVLDDTVPAERTLGMAAGFEWARHADARVVYTDLGITRGMAEGIDRALSMAQPVEYREIGWTDFGPDMSDPAQNPDGFVIDDDEAQR